MYVPTHYVASQRIWVVCGVYRAMIDPKEPKRFLDMDKINTKILPELKKTTWVLFAYYFFVFSQAVISLLKKKSRSFYPVQSHTKSGQLYGIGPNFYEIFNMVKQGVDFRCVQKRTPAVHICNRIGLVIDTKAANFAVQTTATYFETPGSLMLVPFGFLKHPKN